MQINRLFEIVYLLMDKKTATAKQLAEHFEVSPRTIYRDLDILSGAGIPVYTSKGRGGGIQLLEGFVLNKSLLSEQEQNEIIISLQSLNAVKYSSSRQVLDKLSLLFNKSESDWIEIDFSHWGSGSDEQNKFNLLRNAIIRAKTITFQYFSTTGEKTLRTVEPHKLYFKGQGWYLIGFCRIRHSVRMFKIKRMTNLKLNEETFLKTVPLDKYNVEDTVAQTPFVTVILRIDNRLAYRVYDEFEESCIETNPDGTFTVSLTVPEGEWIYAYILSFGTGVEIIQPLHVRKTITNMLKDILHKYS